MDFNINYILNAALELEKAKAKLYKYYCEQANFIDENELKKIPQSVLNSLIPICSYDKQENILNLRINAELPLIKKDIKELRLYWISSITSAISNISEKVFFHKAYLEIFISRSICDLDNLCLKYIIDGVRYSGIIQDDDICNLAYKVEGDIATNTSSTCPFVFIKISELKPTVF